MATIAKEGTYSGKPTLELKWKENSQYPFSFGMSKAKLILASLDAIRAFVERHKDDPKPEKNTESGTPEGQAPEGDRVPAYDRPEPQY